MFRQISYIVMIASVLLSWGILLNLAQTADSAVARAQSPEAGIHNIQVVSYTTEHIPAADLTLKPLPKKLRN